MNSNNTYKKITLGLFSLFFVVSFVQVSAQVPPVSPYMPEDAPESMPADDVTPVSIPPTSPFFPEGDITPVGGPVPPTSPFFPGDDNTTVGGPTVPPTSPFFPEDDNTTVGGGDNPVEPEEPTRPRRSGGSTGGSIPSAPVGDLNSGGEVLGATTEGDSCVMLTTFMRMGMNNDVNEVKLLQSFLNTSIGANLPVTGFFGPLTDAAVRKFQLQYAEQTLRPWMNIGLHSSINTPTGYVYKTTQYTINKMLCPQAEIAFPTLN